MRRLQPNAFRGNWKEGYISPSFFNEGMEVWLPYRVAYEDEDEMSIRARLFEIWSMPEQSQVSLKSEVEQLELKLVELATPPKPATVMKSLRCKVLVAAGDMARIVNETHGVDKWVDLLDVAIKEERHQ